MKRIVSLVGVGAMVMALGLGSAMAQQQTTADSKTPFVKEQPSLEKSGTEAKTGELKKEKATPTATAPAKGDEKMVKTEGAMDNKAPAPSVAPAKPGEKVPGPTVAPAKPEVKAESKAEVKAEKKDAPQAKTDTKAEEAKPVK